MVNLKTGILVVEDEALTRLAVVDVLVDGGFTVYEAATADEAITVLAQTPHIHIVFTDIDMPGKLDGLDLAAHVLEYEQDMSVLVTSGRSAPPPEMGVDFLSKPYDFEALVPRFRALKRSDP